MSYIINNRSTANLILIFVVELYLLIGVSAPIYSQWSSDPSINTAICTSPNEKLHPVITSDGAGGAVIAWYDWRSGIPNLYAQRISASGIVQWTENGIRLCTRESNQSHATLISDGVGGAFISWHDQRASGVDIYAQRISASGELLWQMEGVAICNASERQEYPNIIGDGTGGAIIAWVDERSGSNVDIYAQRINSAGEVQWTADGVTICDAPGNQWTPVTVSDDDGGAIIAWYDQRSSDFDIFAQHIDASGNEKWETNGIAICNISGDQKVPSIINCNMEGAIIVWEDNRNGNYDIYAQSINESGIEQWENNGICICGEIGNQTRPVITSDNKGNAIIAWQDGRNGEGDIYAQRTNTSGTIQWPTNGIAICSAEGSQTWSSGYRYINPIVNDCQGGAIITWSDNRDGFYYDIYAQYVDSLGMIRWTTNGVAVSTALGHQTHPIITSDDGGNAIIVWEDNRSGNNIDIYAQRVEAEGQLSPIRLKNTTEIPLNYTLEQNYPNPFNSKTTIRYQVAQLSHVKIKIYNVSGKEIKTIVNEYKQAGYFILQWDGRDELDKMVSSGIYFCKMEISAKNHHVVQTQKIIYLK